MKVKLISVLLMLGFVTTGVARGQSLDKEMSALAGSLSKELVVQGSKNIAAVDFTDLQGQPTELGRFLSEQLAVEMVLTRSVSVLDRANFKSILAEHKLTEEGLVNPANAKKLGEFAGVDTILIGTVTSLDSSFVLTVKAIATESSRIVAAGRVTFQKTPDLQGIGNRNLSGTTPAAGSTATTAGGTGTAYREASPIATKDIGSLRVVLKSVMPMTLRDPNGRSVNGIRCSFDFVSRETQRPLVVAMNAEGQSGSTSSRSAALGSRQSQTVPLLRASVLDEAGGVWKLLSQALGGLGFVRVGVHGPNGQDAYDASEIVRLLRLRDQLGRGTDDPDDRRPFKPGMDLTPYGGRSPAFVAFEGNRFISGLTTTIGPGQTISVTMSFHQEERATTSGSAAAFFQFNSEFVVGIVAADNKKSYSLQNLTFDRVSMPVF